VIELTHVEQMGQTRAGGLGVKTAVVSALAVLVCWIALAPRAEAFVYWANGNAGTIGRANPDGSSPNQSFIASGSLTRGVAVDAGHIYWARLTGSSTIGRANLDGSSPDQGFISSAGSPEGVAVDGAHIYWANSTASGTIARANLDGSGANLNFITGANFPVGVAVDGDHIYWANAGGNAIGRANLDGSNANQTFISGANNPQGVAVDGAHIYWANVPSPGTGTIGRANLDGSSPDQSFVGAANNPIGVAVDAAHLYWGNFGDGTIGRANVDGMGINQSFITGGSLIRGVAVDSPPALGPAGLGFASVPQGTLSAPQSVTITNTGALPLLISGFSVGGANPDDFFTAFDTCHAPIPSNGSCTAQVQFAPQAQGDRSATLGVQSNDAPATPVALSGAGGPPPAGLAGVGEPGPQGPPGRDAKVTCKVKKRAARVKVKCKVTVTSAAQRRLHWRLTRHRHTFAHGVAVVRRGRATVRITGLGDLPKGRYMLRIAGRDQGTAIVIG
jgi:sugar lactone lactonase YvrE